MAKTPAEGRGKDDGPPDPRERKAFREWLDKRPHEWSVVLATRAALRILPLVSGEEDLATIILPSLRALAIARFAAVYPRGKLGVAPVEAARAAAAIARASVSASNSSSSAAGSIYVPTAAANAASAINYSPAAADAVADVNTLANARKVGTAIIAAVEFDAEQLHELRTRPEIWVRGRLWTTPLPLPIASAWRELSAILATDSSHWSNWIEWYQCVSDGSPMVETTEAWDAAFTDVESDSYPWKGPLPWDDGPEAVNAAITARLRALEQLPLPPSDGLEHFPLRSVIRTVARLAEVASPQPSVTESGQLDAGPNQPFDVPQYDTAVLAEDLSTLPLRQRSLIEGVLSDLPSNAPRYLKRFLELYGNELNIRGTQPILGILKDNADVIAAAVAAPNAEDEWLDPGMRKAFDLFAANHEQFVTHFPLDTEREDLYAQTSVDEAAATGSALTEPLADAKKAADEAHHAGAVTDDFRAAIDAMHDFGRVIASLPPPTPPRDVKASPTGDAATSGETTVKKRLILRAIGFFERASKLIEEKVDAASDAIKIAKELRKVLETMVKFLG